MQSFVKVNMPNKGWLGCLVICLLSFAAGGSPRLSHDSMANSDPQSRLGAPPDYTLQPEDEITVHSLEVKELADKTFRIDQGGEINFPLLGRLHVAGETLRSTETKVADACKKFYQDPDIALTIASFHEEPVSVIGAVGSPGIHSIRGQTTLIDVLASAGGVRGDAGPVVNVTRDASSYGAIPYPTAHNVGAKTSTVSLDLKTLMNAADPSQNIMIRPHDVISVAPADVVYVIGNVKKAGGFPLGGKPHITVIQALALAEGLDARAAAGSARILHQESNSPSTDRSETNVNVTAILKGKAPDILLRPNDILYIPNSNSKLVSQRSIEAAIAIATGMLVFKR